MLAFTGALLKALAPAPLTAPTPTLFAVGQEQPIDRIFDTQAPLRDAGRWHSIYIHQSLTDAGDASSLAEDPEGLADHFLIGNGDGLTDGALQTGPRWTRQAPAGHVPGVDISSDCISICVVGNLNRSRPTPTQQARLLELVTALQRQFGISTRDVVLGAGGSSVAGIGRQFPVLAFRSQLDQ